MTDKTKRQAELMKLTKSELIAMLELVDKNHQEQRQQLRESAEEMAKAFLFPKATAEQKSVKPRKVRNLKTDTEEVTLGLCGYCESTRFLDSHDNFCPNCGTKIDWEEREQHGT